MGIFDFGSRAKRASIESTERCEKIMNDILNIVDDKLPWGLRTFTHKDEKKDGAFKAVISLKHKCSHGSYQVLRIDVDFAYYQLFDIQFVVSAYSRDLRDLTKEQLSVINTQITRVVSSVYNYAHSVYSE